MLAAGGGGRGRRSSAHACGGRRAETRERRNGSGRWLAACGWIPVACRQLQQRLCACAAASRRRCPAANGRQRWAALAGAL
eukprot:357650-Chlamydomonas_euryale.AAC.7